MHLSVRSDLLRDSLNKIQTLVSKKNSRPILNYCLIQASNPDYIELVATDLEIFTRIKIQAKVETEGAFCISAKNFAEILREMPNDSLSLSIRDNKNVLALECKNIKFSLLIVDKEDFPNKVFKYISDDYNVFLSSLQIQNVINKTIHAVSSDESRPFFNGIFFQQISTRLRAVATDGHRLSLIDLLNFETPNEFLVDGILISKRGINEIKKMVDTYPNEVVRILLDESFIHLQVQDRYFLSIRLVVREFPKYQTVIPSKTTYQVILHRSSLLTAVKRIRILATDRYNGVKFILSEKNLVITANHPSLGDATESISIEYDGPSIEIGFNANFIIDALSVFESEEILIEFNNELNPVIIRSMYLPEFLSVIMPLKL